MSSVRSRGETAFGPATRFTNDPDELSPDNTARRVNLPESMGITYSSRKRAPWFPYLGTQCEDRGITVPLGNLGRFNDIPHPRGFRLPLARQYGSPQEANREYLRYKEGNGSASTS